MARLVPYPLRAMRINFTVVPFRLVLVPRFHRRKTMTEQAKVDGNTQWWADWLWFQISYERAL